MTMMTNSPETLIVGLGPTGLSVARYLGRQGASFSVVDSRINPPGMADLQREFPDAPCHFGDFNTSLFDAAKRLIVSPGVAVATPQIAAARLRGAEIIGDVELFVREAQAPIIAITGSNGKSSVTKLVAEMAQAAGWRAYAVGNIGWFVLDALTEPVPDLYVVELSSFQLETTQSLRAKAAVVLNLCEDHMDRYASFADYVAAKAVIYNNCEHAVLNCDDAAVMQLEAGLSLAADATSYFGMDEDFSDIDDNTGDAQYCVRSENDARYLAKGTRCLLPVSAMRLPGEHNVVNALAALALGSAAGIPEAAMLSAIRDFNGLPHRTEWVFENNGVNWFNDSKGTNVGATLAALQGLPGKTVLIAGGQGKGADFSPLRSAIRQHARAVVLIGEDAAEIAQVMAGVMSPRFADNMNEAVMMAAALAEPGDNVLLSPACASFDMFENYVRRGEIFTETVRRLAA